MKRTPFILPVHSILLKLPQLKKLDGFTLPWIPVLKPPKMDFRAPKIPLPHQAPHKYIIIFLILSSSYFLSGGIYNLAERSVLPLGFNERGYQPIYPGLNEQFLVESFSINIFILLGTTGMFLLRHAVFVAKEGQPASFMVILGLILLIIFLLSAIFMFQLKVEPIIL